MRVLCLGNNTEDTDLQTKQLAAKNCSQCHGLLTQIDVAENVTDKEGWYHSSVYDIAYGDLEKLAGQFDQVIMLPQPKTQYSHPDAFYLTVKLVKGLPNGIFLDNTYDESITFFENLVATNHSICIFPFIELLTNQRDDGYTTVCCRSNRPVTHISKITDWATDPGYVEIRKKMLSGERLPTHCQSCYQLESMNILSARQQETVEWANRLNITSIEDLQKIKSPAYYEIRPSNKCNLQCRMCSPNSSHLIGKEYKALGLISEIPPDQRTDFDLIDFSTLKKLYVGGGEPTVMPEFYEFLDKCIAEQKVDFEFLLNTNGTKLSNRFKEKLKHFTNFQFIVSLDGYHSLNHYIRWPSDWNTIIENMHYLKNNKHKCATNITVSIYNVLGLYDLLEFLENEFPDMLIHCGMCQSIGDKLSPLIFPDHELALQRLLPIRHLDCYANDHLLKSFIDGLIAHYQSRPLPKFDKLKSFFEFNDQLDQSRNLRLEEYIPELHDIRNLLT